MLCIFTKAGGCKFTRKNTFPPSFLEYQNCISLAVFCYFLVCFRRAIFQNSIDDCLRGLKLNKIFSGMSILMRRAGNANTLSSLNSFDRNVKDSLDFIFVQDRITKWMEKYGQFILKRWTWKKIQKTLSLLIAALSVAMATFLLTL